MWPQTTPAIEPISGSATNAEIERISDAIARPLVGGAGWNCGARLLLPDGLLVAVGLARRRLAVRLPGRRLALAELRVLVTR